MLELAAFPVDEAPEAVDEAVDEAPLLALALLDDPEELSVAAPNTPPWTVAGDEPEASLAASL